MIPAIEQQLREESDMNKKHLFMTREGYILHTAQGMSMGDIGEELGISKGTVQGYIEKARKKVRERVGLGETNQLSS